MKYNPQIHHRRSIRLKGYDYSKAGAYFITICCQNRICRFGHIENEQMILNDLGTMAYHEWTQLTERFPNIELDVFQIMPNHVHGIILIKTVGATLAVAQDSVKPNPVAPNPIEPNPVAPDLGQPQGCAPTIADIIGAYKSLVFNACLEIFKTKNKTMGKLWQRNYHDHIIRDEKSHQNISNYIINNPKKWNEDKFYRK